MTNQSFCRDWLRRTTGMRWDLKLPVRHRVGSRQSKWSKKWSPMSYWRISGWNRFPVWWWWKRSRRQSWIRFLLCSVRTVILIMHSRRVILVHMHICWNQSRKINYRRPCRAHTRPVWRNWRAKSVMKAGKIWSEKILPVFSRLLYRNIYRIKFPMKKCRKYLRSWKMWSKRATVLLQCVWILILHIRLRMHWITKQPGWNWYNLWKNCFQNGTFSGILKRQKVFMYFWSRQRKMRQCARLRRFWNRLKGNRKVRLLHRFPNRIKDWMESAEVTKRRRDFSSQSAAVPQMRILFPYLWKRKKKRQKVIVKRQDLRSSMLFGRMRLKS